MRNLALADAGQHPLPKVGTRGGIALAQGQKRGHVAHLGDLALRLGRCGQERLEALHFVGRERAERVGGGEVVQRFLPGAGHVPRSR